MADGRVPIVCDKCKSPMAYTGPLCDKLECNQCKAQNSARTDRELAALARWMGNQKESEWFAADLVTEFWKRFDAIEKPTTEAPQ
jgi:hypothetical protein